MPVDKQAIIPIAAKYAKRENLNAKETKMLRQWWDEDPRNRTLCDVFQGAEQIKSEPGFAKETRAQWEQLSKGLDEIKQVSNKMANDSIKPKRNQWLVIFINLFKRK